jgi:hypothetical protein
LAGVNLPEADMQAGFKDVEAELQDGSKRTVRVSAVAPELRDPLLRQYASRADARGLLRPMLADEFASDAFLDSLKPWSLARLANTAVGLLFGAQALKQLVKFGTTEANAGN